MKLSCCASCGVTEIDDVKLKQCDGCDLVKYCGDECREIHKSEHEEACKKRAAKLRDELLFKLPESSHWGDCPICCLPLSIDVKKSTMYMCCSKIICKGCEYANDKREMELRLRQSCPFCREPWPETEAKWVKQRMKRVEANDPAALCHQGVSHYKKGHYSRAFQYFEKAAELGDVEAHLKLACLYHEGNVAEKDKEKYIHHLKEAAIGGHPDARYNLGCVEWNNGDKERAVKHYIIAAAQGEDGSIKALMKMFKGGFLEKEILAAALRAHQAAVDATKSPQRDAAEE